MTTNQSKNARTRFAIYAVKIGRQFILLNLAKPNRIIEAELHKRRFSFLGERNHILHEKTIEGYKSDLYIEDTKTIIEIKSIISLKKEATFPTINSERSLKQLKKLSGLLKSGYRVCYMFVSLSPNLREVSTNQNIEGYTEIFRECIDNGMTVYGVNLKLVNNRPIICSSLVITNV